MAVTRKAIERAEHIQRGWVWCSWMRGCADQWAGHHVDYHSGQELTCQTWSVVPLCLNIFLNVYNNLVSTKKTIIFELLEVMSYFVHIQLYIRTNHKLPWVWTAAASCGQCWAQHQTTEHKRTWPAMQPSHSEATMTTLCQPSSEVPELITLLYWLHISHLISNLSATATQSNNLSGMCNL